jgi:hypothetical protein
MADYFTNFSLIITLPDEAAQAFTCIGSKARRTLTTIGNALAGKRSLSAIGRHSLRIDLLTRQQRLPVSARRGDCCK